MSEPDPVPAWREVGVIAGVLAATALLAVPTWWAMPPTNHDVAAIAAVADRMLSGERLYTDLPQPNPPQVFWAEAVVVAAARAAGVDVLRTLAVAIVGLTAALLAQWAWTLRALRLPDGLAGRATLVAAGGVVAFGFGNADLGQRDPLLVLTLLPYLTTVAARRTGAAVPVSVALAAGVIGGLGVSLKPQFLLAPLAVEAWLLATTRRASVLARTELLAAGAAWIGLYGVVLLGTDYLHNVLTWAAGYQSFGSLGVASTMDLVVSLAGWPAVGLAAVLVQRRAVGPAGPGLAALQVALGVLVVPLAASVLVQGKGFSYHLWPVQAAGMLLVGTACAAAWTSARAASLAGVAALTLGAGVAGNDALRSWVGAGLRPYDRTYPCPARTDPPDAQPRCTVGALTAAIEAHTSPGDPVAMVYPTVHPAGWATVDAGVRDVVRVPPMLLPDRYTEAERAAVPFRYHDAAARDRIETAVLDGLADSIARERPTLIVFDDRAELRGFGRTDFSLVAFFRQHRAIAAALDEDYVEAGADGLNGAARLFVRR